MPDNSATTGWTIGNNTPTDNHPPEPQSPPKNGVVPTIPPPPSTSEITPTTATPPLNASAVIETPATTVSSPVSPSIPTMVTEPVIETDTPSLSESTPPPPPPPKKSHKTLIMIMITLFIALSIPLAVYLAKNVQDIRQRAADVGPCSEPNKIECRSDGHKYWCDPNTLRWDGPGDPCTPGGQSCTISGYTCVTGTCYAENALKDDGQCGRVESTISNCAGRPDNTCGGSGSGGGGGTSTAQCFTSVAGTCTQNQLNQGCTQTGSSCYCPLACSSTSINLGSNNCAVVPANCFGRTHTCQGNLTTSGTNCGDSPGPIVNAGETVCASPACGTTVQADISCTNGTNGFMSAYGGACTTITPSPTPAGGACGTSCDNNSQCSSGLDCTCNGSGCGGVCWGSRCDSTTPSPTPPGVGAQCDAVKIYSVTGDITVANSWHLLTAAELTGRKSGDIVYVSTLGSGINGGVINRARIRVLTGNAQATAFTTANETTIKKPQVLPADPEEYYIQYTIPAQLPTPPTFTFESEVCMISNGNCSWF